jgi:hypothetical protein
MAAKKGQVYTHTNGGTIGENDVTGLSITHKGETRDGFQVIHYTLYRNKRRMSYDTVRINDEYHYVLGSGHEVDENGNVSRWDSGNQVYGDDACKRYAREILSNFNG